MTKHVLVVADSLAFHGPTQFERPDDERLYPNVMGAALGPDVEVELVARPGWTARDAWWALTKDPNVWGRWLPEADAVVIGVGGMDAAGFATTSGPQGVSRGRTTHRPCHWWPISPVTAGSHRSLPDSLCRSDQALEARSADRTRWTVRVEGDHVSVQRAPRQGRQGRSSVVGPQQGCTRRARPVRTTDIARRIGKS
jgi:hypothetical protein